ncbi:MAG: glycosyltransferase [Roseburia sp.]|nr:glycosyltransferase [Roseburia sp.]
MREEKRIRDLTVYEKFLAYTHDEGPDDVEVWNGKKRFKKLRNTPLWNLLTPAREVWHGMQFVYVHGVKGMRGKVKNKIENNKWKKRREALAFLQEIMPSEEEKKRQSKEKFSVMPKISVLVPLYNTPEQFLRDMIESVLNQTYTNLELCLADASDSEHGNVASIVDSYVKDSRIVYQKLAKNGGIADNTNACIEMASGEYLALFDHDDILHPSALYECAKAIAEKGAEFVYTDEVTFEGENLENIVTYHFKPDFSVDNLRGVNYICHLSVFKKDLVDQVGMFSKDYDGSQDHDMILRLTDAAKIVCHVPKVLYFWRCHQMSTSMNLDAKSYAIDAGRRAVRDAETRRGYPAKVRSAQICKTHYRMEYEIGTPWITVLIDERNSKAELSDLTKASIKQFSTYKNYDIDIVKQGENLKTAAEKAKGEYIVLLLAGMELISGNWLEELLMFAQRKDVALAGMQILDENNNILSSDIVVGTKKEYLALEVNKGQSFDAPGYMGRNYYAHNISAISGSACMMKKEFLLANYEEGYSAMGEAIAMCIHARKEGLNIVLNPYALCQINTQDYQTELTDKDKDRLLGQFKTQIKAGDPYYNKNLSYTRFWQKK